MATVTFVHAHDHALVNLNGALDWDAAHDLVTSVEALVEQYFYRVIEVVVTSPGGESKVLEHLLSRMDRWEEEGIRIRTRVVSSAASAAAVLVSAGRERAADPGSCLTYHYAHLEGGADKVNARATAAIRAFLKQVDDRMVARLVGRALATPAARGDGAFAAEESDRRVLAVLWASLGRDGEAPRKLGRLARAVGRFVARAVRKGDREGLTRLYRRLFESELPISPSLALTLRLLDRVGPAPAGARTSSGAPGLTVPEWDVLYPPDGVVPREVLTRHTLVLGETGSGKTASCILPVLAAMARAPRERVGGALVIDPKRELGRTLEALAPERLHHVHADRVVLDVMAGTRWSLEADLAAGRWRSAARKVLCRVASFVPSSPARVLVRPGSEASSTNKDFFDREATALVETVIAFVLMMIHPGTPSPEQWIKEDKEALAWAVELIEQVRGTDQERGPNLLATVAWVLEGPLLLPPTSSSSFTVSGDGVSKQEPRWLFATLACDASEHLCQGSSEGRDLCMRVVGYWLSLVLARDQYAGVRATARTICQDFAGASIARALYFGFEAGYAAARSTGDGLHFERLVAADSPVESNLVLFQPARDDQDRLVAVCLKALFFEAVLDDRDRVRGGDDLPLVGYLADEAHRFVTSDVVHGEQSFLDTCRSASAFCVLASQSIASIEHALAHGGGSSEQNRASVEILSQNTATKLVFRSTDVKTARRVAELGPTRFGHESVVRVRPVSTLAPGECYAILADGRFERRQLGRFAGVAPPGQAALPEEPVRQEGRS